MYRRRDDVTFSGEIPKCPPRSASRTRQKTAGESKRGKHAQSTEPSRETSAAEWQSPMIA
jgi:hypothetical protein